MTLFGFIADVINSLAWPITVLIAIYLLKNDVSKLIKKVVLKQISFGTFTADFEAMAEITKAVNSEASNSLIEPLKSENEDITKETYLTLLSKYLISAMLAFRLTYMIFGSGNIKLITPNEPDGEIIDGLTQIEPLLDEYRKLETNAERLKEVSSNFDGLLKTKEFTANLENALVQKLGPEYAKTVKIS